MTDDGPGGVPKTGGRTPKGPVAITPVGPVRGRARVPASKSLTNRALVLGALARGRTRLLGPLVSDDTKRMIAALRALGVAIEATSPAAPEGSVHDGTSTHPDARAPRAPGPRVVAHPDVDESSAVLDIEGRGGDLDPPAGALDVGGSGTAMRFLTALAALVPGEVVVDGHARLRERPIGPLLDALRALGVEARASGEDGRPPARVRGGTLEGGRVRLPGDISSQFVSALLMVAPLAAGPVDLEIDPPIVSRPYIDLTLALMERFGVVAQTAARLASGGLRVTFPGRGHHPLRPVFGGGQGLAGDAMSAPRTASPGDEAGTLAYRATTYRIPADASSAAYLFGAAAITAGRVLVEGLDPDDGQADAVLLRLLPGLGCEVGTSEPGTVVAGPPSGTLASFDLDCADFPDLVPMLAVLALFADGPSVVRGAANQRRKETDRLRALATEIRRLGAGAEERPDGLRIVPGPLRGARIATYDDHRIAMAFAIAGLRIPGVLIEDPGCVAKSFPGFWTTLADLAPGVV